MTQSDVFESYPLSPLQEGMLFHALARLGKGVDIEQIVATLHEPVDTQALEKAWNLLLERHEVLRSRFEWEGLPEPRQVVVPSVSLRLRAIDLRTRPREEQESFFAAFLQTERKHDFDMSRAPLMRVTLFQLGPEDYKFLWSFHHILLDGRSFPLLLEELFEAYDALLRGRRIEADPPRPFRDYVRWVRERDLTEDRRFWTDCLAGFSTPTPLVVDRPLSAGQRTVGGQGAVEVRLPKDLCSALRSVAEAYGLSMNTFLEAAWALVLHRYSGEEDIVYGTTRSCRRGSIEGAERMIGLLINTVPVRVQVREDIELAEWLRGLRKLHLTLRDHIHAPLYKIHEWSEVPGAHPLFESLVVFEKYSLESRLRAKGGAWLTREFTYLGRTNYPLSILGYDGEEMELRIEYDKDRFADDTIQRMIGHIQTVLSHIPECLDRPVSEVPILTEAERHQLLVEWNDTSVACPHDLCLHELFEAQVERTPEAVAVVFEGSKLTYRELNRRANQLARRLRALGVGPEVLVGLYMERSLEMVVGILGILKAGGAYVPLDPIYPKERISFILQDMKATVIVTDSKMAVDLPPSSAQIVTMDLLEADPQFESDSSREHQRSGVGPDNLAYVIYTSGSTGKPKGVLISHWNVIRLFRATDPWFSFGPNDVWTMFHSYAFDFSVWELWGALLYGGRLVIVPYDVSRTPRAFYTLLVREGVTVLNQTPSAFKQLLEVEEEPSPDKRLSLRLVIFGGEALDLQTLKPWVDRHGDTRPQLVNMYGITETTVHVTYRPITRDDIAQSKGSVIGVPIPDLQVYVLDQRLEPVPIGVPGELYVGGAGVGRGYLNRSELTAERFIPDPFSKIPGRRLYKSGDLVRYLPGQDLEYLGRIDFQVQVRGFRVELGEIEAVLAEHPSVRQVVVLAREDTRGELRLVAYIVPKDGPSPGSDTLANHVRKKLPEYMVPNAFVMLERFPLTANGKIDRRALPPPPTSRPELESTYIPPHTQIEKTIAAIWQEVLDVERVGVDDNFFDLGGHSLRMAKVHARLCEALKTSFSMLDLFRYPTIRSLAHYLRREGKDKTDLEQETAQAEKLRQGRHRLQRHLKQRKQA